MTRTDLVARLGRLEVLTIELLRDRGEMEDGFRSHGFSMLRAEWLEFDQGMTAAIRGVENARVVLAQATERMEREAAGE